MKVHELDCISDVFQDIYNGVRSFDIRDDDRDYEIGDSLHLKEYNIKTQSHSGRWISKRVTYIQNISVPYGTYDLVVMAII